MARHIQKKGYFLMVILAANIEAASVPDVTHFDIMNMVFCNDLSVWMVAAKS